MKLVNGAKLIDYAKKHKKIIPAFNTTNLETTRAIIEGLNEAKTPGIIAISSNNLSLSSPQIIADMVRSFNKDGEIPVVLHLDHGTSFEDVKACVDAGFTSIMVDASHLPYEENIKEVKRVVDYCHMFNIPVEAELGEIGGKEDDMEKETSGKTDPTQVKEFVLRTGIDILAVAIGNVHGFDALPEIDFELLETISKESPVPLVLHGGSGIPLEDVRKTRNYNIVKVNYGSDLRRAMIGTFGEAYKENENEFNLMSLSEQSVEAIKARVISLSLDINK